MNDAGGIHGEEAPPDEVVKIMDAANVQKTVILTGMWGEKLQGVLDKMVNVYPNRFMVFAQIAYSKIDNANFGAEMVQQLDDSVRRGARGLKVLKDLGLGVKDKSGNLITVDDPRLDPVWEKCGKLGIPVAIHTSDPEAFFEPEDNRNERYEALMHNPTWSFYGPQFPNKKTLLPSATTSSRSTRTRGRTRPPAQARGRVFPEVSGSHTLWNRQRSRGNDVGQLFAMVGNSG